MARRLSASSIFFVAPTGLRYLLRLRPHPRFDLHPRRARYGFPSPVASFRSCPLSPTRSSQFDLSAIERLQAWLVSHGLPRHLPRPRLLPHLDFLSHRPRPTPVLTLPPSSPSTMSSAPYQSSSATSTPAPLLLRVPPTHVHCLFLPWQYYYSCALSLPFCPVLCSCPLPPRAKLLVPPAHLRERPHPTPLPFPQNMH